MLRHRVPHGGRVLVVQLAGHHVAAGAGGAHLHIVREEGEVVLPVGVAGHGAQRIPGEAGEHHTAHHRQQITPRDPVLRLHQQPRHRHREAGQRHEEEAVVQRRAKVNDQVAHHGEGGQEEEDAERGGMALRQLPQGPQPRHGQPQQARPCEGRIPAHDRDHRRIMVRGELDGQHHQRDVLPPGEAHRGQALCGGGAQEGVGEEVAGLHQFGRRVEHRGTEGEVEAERNEQRPCCKRDPAGPCPRQEQGHRHHGQEGDSVLLGRQRQEEQEHTGGQAPGPAVARPREQGDRAQQAEPHRQDLVQALDVGHHLAMQRMYRVHHGGQERKVGPGRAIVRRQHP